MKFSKLYQMVSERRSHVPRARIPKTRGGLSKEKILRYLKRNLVQSKSGPAAGWLFAREFDTPQQLADHTYWHGSGSGVSGGLKPSITMSEAEVESAGGGGYGERYWGISVSKNKNLASNFTGTSRSGNVYMVLLHKDAVVKDMPELSDAADVEEHIVRLWEDGVDAVWIGDEADEHSEQELVVLNPQAVWIGRGEHYPVFQKKRFEQPSADELWDDTRKLEGESAEADVRRQERAKENSRMRQQAQVQRLRAQAEEYRTLAKKFRGIDSEQTYERFAREWGAKADALEEGK